MEKKSFINDMDKNSSMHRILKTLCIFGLSQLTMLLVLNHIFIGGKWATMCKEWVVNNKWFLL